MTVNFVQMECQTLYGIDPITHKARSVFAGDYTETYNQNYSIGIFNGNQQIPNIPISYSGKCYIVTPTTKHP